MVARFQSEVDVRWRYGFVMIRKEMKVRWRVWTLAAIFVIAAVILWYWNDTRQFDFGRAFNIRLGMPVEEFNARYGSDFVEGSCNCSKLNIETQDGFSLTGIRVSPLEHLVEGYVAMRRFPTNEYQTALSVYDRMCRYAERRGLVRTEHPFIPNQPKEVRFDTWKRQDKSFNDVMATTTIALVSGWCCVSFSESMKHEPAYAAFREEVERSLKECIFDPLSPLGASLTNTYAALHFSEQEIKSCTFDMKTLRHSPKSSRVSLNHKVGRGYSMTNLRIDERSGWVDYILLSRSFGQDERGAKVEYSVLIEQIKNSISNTVIDCSYTSPFGTVYSDFLAANFNDRSVRYFPRLMHLTDSTSSVWRVDLVVDTYGRRQ